MVFPENDAPADTWLRRELTKEKGLDRVIVAVRSGCIRHPKGAARVGTPVRSRYRHTCAELDQLQSRRGTAESPGYKNLIAGLRGGSQDGPPGRYLADEN